MAKSGAKFPSTIPSNKYRAINKKARGRGILAMGNIPPAEWSTQFDKLHGIKGLERMKLKKQLNIR